MEESGYELDFQAFPLKRVPFALNKGDVDGAMTITEKLFGGQAEALFYTNNYITYRNYAITLEKNKFKIDDIKSLSGFSVIGFQNAKMYLGDDFEAAIAKSPYYSERQLK